MSLAADFLALHVPGEPLLMPNPWDIGSAKILQSLGFSALATTSSGAANSLGRLDGAITIDEALAHIAAVVGAVDAPVSADFENGFADDPAEVAGNIRRAAATGLAGCSIEDFTGNPDGPIYCLEHAEARIEAAASAGLVLTARCENYLHGNPDLADTITRLQHYEAAGADVLYAPGLTAPSDIKTLIGEVSKPVNVLLLAGAPSVAELADLGVARISVGGAFANVAWAALASAARDLLAGEVSYLDAAAEGRAIARAAFFSGPSD